MNATDTAARAAVAAANSAVMKLRGARTALDGARADAVAIARNAGPHAPAWTALADALATAAGDMEFDGETLDDALNALDSTVFAAAPQPEKLK